MKRTRGGDGGSGSSNGPTAIPVNSGSNVLQVAAFVAERAADLQLLVAQQQQRRGEARSRAEVSGAGSARAAERERENAVSEEVRHMRRRTRSHQSFKVPRKLREGGSLAGILSSKSSKKKAVRGKRGVVIDERNRAQCRMGLRALSASKRVSPTDTDKMRLVWSDTHLWSAKRMAMGVGADARSTAVRSREKGTRFTANQTRHGCTVCDVSTFTACLRVTIAKEGVRANLASSLAKLGAAALIGAGFIEGKRAGFIDAVHWPLEICNGRHIGPVTFLWDPSVSAEDSTLFGQCVYLLCDPRAEKELAECIKECVSNVLVKSMRRQLNVLRLRGERTHEVLSRAIGGSTDGLLRTKKGKAALWDKGIAQGGLRTPDSLPLGTGAVLSLDIASLQKERGIFNFTKSMGNSVAADLQCRWMEEGPPGSVPLGKAISNMMIETSEESNTVGIVCLRSVEQGWDIVVPTGLDPDATSCLWLRFVHAGATASGSANEGLATIATGKRSFPADYPGCTAYDAYWRALKDTETSKNTTTPLSKRPQNLPWPLVPPWASLRLDGNRNPISRSELVCVMVTLCHSQPRGTKAWLDRSARISLAHPKDLQAWKLGCSSSESKACTWTGVSVDQARTPAGFVTSCMGRGRVVANAGTSAFGLGFCLRSALESTQEGRSLLKHRTHHQGGLFVLVRNRREDNGQAVYCVGHIHLVF